MYQSLLKLLGEAGLEGSQIFLSGDPMDDRFELKFLGSQTVSIQNCTHFANSLNLGRGKYKTQTCLGPNQEQVQFYCQPDKNLGQVRKEVLAKALQKHVQGLLPNSEIWVRKATGTVLVDKRPLVSVKVLNEDTASLVNWNEPKLILHKLDKAQISEAFKALVAGGEQSSS